MWVKKDTFDHNLHFEKNPFEIWGMCGAVEGVGYRVGGGMGCQVGWGVRWRGVSGKFPRNSGKVVKLGKKRYCDTTTEKFSTRPSFTR